MTNYEKIKAMSIEDMGMLFCEIASCEKCFLHTDCEFNILECKVHYPCPETWLGWLDTDVEETKEYDSDNCYGVRTVLLNSEVENNDR